ncbi:MAG: hypothetical protein ABIR70_22740 [Bryobacteraceae bacterium]
MNTPSIVHLAENSPSASRALTTGRAYPLGEASRPDRAHGTAAIIRYLDVEKSARYQAARGQTFCNIYACDYCYLAGAYLPRVWWTTRALTDIAAGRSVPVKYAESVAELDANSLYTWLRDFGACFGWTLASSLDELQAAANAGQVCVISARRVVPQLPGHIAVVAPESTPPMVAEKTASGIRVPLQSQAGRLNYCFSCAPGRWWESPKFAAFGFWIHAGKQI